MNVVEHGTRGVGGVGGVDCAGGQVPEEPGVDGAEGEIAFVGAGSRSGNVVEEPAEFAGGEVCVDDEAGFVLDGLEVAVAFELVAELGGATVLPDNGVVEGLAGVAVPEEGGFALVGDADGGDVVCNQVGFAKRVMGDLLLRIPDVGGVVFDPAGLGVELGEFLLGDGLDVAVVVEDNGAGTGGALVEGEDVRHGGDCNAEATKRRRSGEVATGLRLWAVKEAMMLCEWPLEW